MRKRDLNDKAAVQAAVRQVADEYLPDPNINSVGVGYKVTDGKRTQTLALQFTVGQKFAPEALEAVETRPIPEQIVANGITFATDVVEREFEPHPTRSSDRPNPLGLHEVMVLGIDGLELAVGPLEAIDGTPVVDIKSAL